MNRRSFLSLLGVGAAAAVLDPEKLLWVPGAKTISIPAAVWHGEFPLRYYSVDIAITKAELDAFVKPHAFLECLKKARHSIQGTFTYES